MAFWLFYLLSLLFSLSLSFLLFRPKPASPPLPPGPLSIPVLSSILSLSRSSCQLESLLHKLKQKHGPILTLKFFSRPVIFITDRSIAHRALIQLGAYVSDRPSASSAPNRLFSDDQLKSISSSTYGPTWRALRRNLMAEVLNPARVRAFGPARKWALEVLVERFKEEGGGGVAVMEEFLFALFCLVVFMCFGVKIEEKKIKEIKAVQRELISYFVKVQVFTFFPRITKVLFRKRWNKIISLRKKQEELFIPLIRARKDKKEGEKESIYSYVDSLLDLKLPEGGGRKLNEGEIVSLCSEFLAGGTETTATSLQWIMANLTKNADIQNKLWTEIKQVVGTNSQEPVEMEDLHKMSYLKAVVLEALRLHPPGHFVLPHTVSEDIQLNGYLIPKGAQLNFAVAEIGKDESVWSYPTKFKPERFTKGGEGEGIDVTGNKEIKMMPFGAGRRICPGLGLAFMHLEYFVANLVKEFEWKEIEGEKVDLSEELEFSVVMKQPLRARILPH